MSSEYIPKQPLKQQKKYSTWVEILLLVLRVVLGGVFVLAGVKKLLAPVEEFEAAIRTFEALPTESFVHLVAVALPWVEVLAGVLLILGALLPVMLWIHAILLLGFIVLVSQGMLRGLDIDCGCFGSGPSSPTETLVRDVLLLGVAGILIRWQSNRFGIDRWLSGNKS